MVRKLTAKTRSNPRRRRGIYVLPNLLTTGALFFGFFAIIQATIGKFEFAAVGILIAAVLDGLDGRVARLTDTFSDFGKEYDSLSDVICFGLAPALVLFEWTLSGLGKAGWLAAFLYVSAAALRLARFNTQSSSDPGYFQGIPCPMAAAFLVSWMWFVISSFDADAEIVRNITVLLLVLLALAMVSALPYLSFKNIGVKGRVPFVASVAFVFVIALISFDPPKVIFGLCLIYLASGPFILAARHLRRKPLPQARQVRAHRNIESDE